MGLPHILLEPQVEKPNQRNSLEYKFAKTVVHVGDSSIGGDELAVIAGPCLIESRAQVFNLAQTVHQGGAKFFCAGAFSTSQTPHATQGLEEEELEILVEVRGAFGLKIIIEALDNRDIGLAAHYADMILIGAHNMQNFSLLRHAARSRLPVILKRSAGATLDDWLVAAECLMSEGNYNIVLCESGIRTFNQHTRETLDLAAIPSIRRLSPLPVIVDPTHSAGKGYMVAPLACAAIAAGADGIIVTVEVNNSLQRARADGSESLAPEQYEQMILKLHAIYELLGASSNSV